MVQRCVEMLIDEQDEELSSLELEPAALPVEKKKRRKITLFTSVGFFAT